MNEKNVNKFRLSRSVAPKSKSITRFDCRAAVCLPNNFQECLEIQEATGEVWISLEHNVIDTAAMNGEIVSMPVLAQWTNISINFTADS